jgi:predicted DNA-binding helix-hairpin-helix protein
MPVTQSALLPAIGTKPPLLREHRLYQADWLLRYYGFSASELLDSDHQNFSPYVDPKCNWAINHMELFPVEVNRAPYEELLRVPGIGVRSAKRIVTARRAETLGFGGLKKLGVVLKRAQYFITCSGKCAEGLKVTPDSVIRSLLSETAFDRYRQNMPVFEKPEQLSFFGPAKLQTEDIQKCLTGQL